MYGIQNTISLYRFLEQPNLKLIKERDKKISCLKFVIPFLNKLARNVCDYCF